MSEFLPRVRVTTIVWADENIPNRTQWEVAQGDDLKNNCSTIEINLPKIAERGHPKGEESEFVAKSMVEGWLHIYLVLATRQELINKGVRGHLSAKAENILCNANFNAIMESQFLRQTYADLATNEILDGIWDVFGRHKSLASKTQSVLSGWQRVYKDLDHAHGKCYLCGKTLLSPEYTPTESLKFATETPFTEITPTPFIKAIVWICQNCVPIAKQMGLQAEPFEITTKE